MTFALRPAEDRDLDALCALFVELFKKAARGRPDLFRAPCTEDPEERARLRQYVAARLALTAEAMIVADEAGGVLGLVHVLLEPVPESRIVPFRRASLEAWVLHLVVGARHRGRGVGRALDGEAHAWARAQGAQTLGLQVWGYNEAAARFFERCGYQTRSTHLYRPC